MGIFHGEYGAEMGAAALKFLPLGGMYVAGGLTPKNIGPIRAADGAFMNAFYDKGRLSPVMRRVPLYAVMVEDIGQRGAHLVAYKLLQQVRSQVSKESAIVNQWAKRGVHAKGLPTSRAAIGLVAAFALGVLLARGRRKY